MLDALLLQMDQGQSTPAVGANLIHLNQRQSAHDRAYRLQTATQQLLDLLPIFRS